MIHTSAFSAIREGNGKAPCGIAYLQGEGWFTYDLTKGITAGTPELLCVRQGALPVPVSEEGRMILAELMEINDKVAVHNLLLNTTVHLSPA